MIFHSDAAWESWCAAPSSHGCGAVLFKHPVVEQGEETFEPFLHALIRIIPFLTEVQVLSGGIPPE